jgi:plastocyanin
VPLTATVQVLSRVALAAGIAVDGVVDPLVGRFADTYRVPVGFAAVITPARMVDVGAAFTFPDLLGRSDLARPRSDARVVQAFIALRTGGGSTPAPAAAPAMEEAAPASLTISIENFAFVPPSLDVPPGATVTVRNGDPAPHSVTSESAPGEFAPGGVAGVAFDTGPFTGARSFTIPADAPPGTVVPFYCSVHRERMATPNGAIRVVAPR